MIGYSTFMDYDSQKVPLFAFDQFPLNASDSKKSEIITDALNLTSKRPPVVLDAVSIPANSSVFIDVSLPGSGIGFVVEKTGPLSVTGTGPYTVPSSNWQNLAFSRDIAQLRLGISYKSSDVPGRTFSTILTVFGSGSPSIERNWKYWTSLYLDEQWNALRPETGNIDNIFSARGR
jgi:hypothetical protein